MANYYNPSFASNFTAQPQQMQMTQFNLKGKPVTSIEEVKGCMIDFDGSVFYFPDIANKRIYTKQINLDGTSTLKVYGLIEQPIETLQPGFENLVTKQDFEKIVGSLVNEINVLKEKVAAASQKESSQLASAKASDSAPQFNF